VTELERRLQRPLPPGWPDGLDQAVREVFAAELIAVPGVREAVTALRTRTCIASSGSRATMRYTLGLIGLGDLFDGRIYSGEEVPRGKPAPDLFLQGRPIRGRLPHAARLTPTRGAVTVGGVTASDGRDRDRARTRATSIGFVFQDAALDPTRPVIDSVLEPVLYHPTQTRGSAVGRARSLLADFGVDHRSQHRPGEISGGQGLRVALCRALVTDPPIILADEPTGNLDRYNAEIVLGALSSAAHSQGRCVVVATHDPFVLASADAVLGLDA